LSRKRKPAVDRDEDRDHGGISSIARDNPVAAGGMVVMALTGCLIVANALGLQSGRHPAPLFITRDRADVPAMIEPADRIGVETQVVSPLVLDLQTAFRRLGLYEGPLDGLNGPATERAIRSYERSQGRAETGKPSEALLALVTLQGDTPRSSSIPVPARKPGSRAPASVDVANARQAPPSDPALLQVQQLLSDLGYGPLRADGVIGENTTSAIKRFELDRGLPITGQLTPEVIARLEMISGQKIRN
jgi:peptidoglycan hydrolase-like protein with peptidoglycan-binding domain